jgi:hypothetical protein
VEPLAFAEAGTPLWLRKRLADASRKLRCSPPQGEEREQAAASVEQVKVAMSPGRGKVRYGRQSSAMWPGSAAMRFSQALMPG